MVAKQKKHASKIILLPELSLRGVENILQETFLPRLKTQ
jgi:hypothetical protein